MRNGMEKSAGYTKGMTADGLYEDDRGQQGPIKMAVKSCMRFVM